MRRWVLAVMAGAVSPAAMADSVWERRDPRYAFLFQDNRARQIGDILTIEVIETTVANNQDARALNRTTATSGQVSFFGTGKTTAGGTAGGGGTTPATGVLFPFPSENSSRAFNGTASMTTNQVFTDRLAVTVVDMMPNGNLVVEGYRSRVVAGEERVLRITGLIRQQDVGNGNIVLSQSVANLRISYLGRGPASRTVNQSYLGRFINLIRPF
ncbi:MAG: flgH [Gemmataceae bacterium]|nr:flgH [Gemmataceae bacterium]